ncbi:MAG TPA: glycosyltransferase [Candidatus Acidoferrum sp.]|nr:glycosyltransferase [Candidatus Acidoferrum sp.]
MDSRNARAVIIVVNYQGADNTLSFLESISRLTGFSEVEVIIVDNSSADDSAARIRRGIGNFANVSLFQSQANRGYFGGANWALQQYLARGFTPDWVVVCNNDILFPDSQFLMNLFRWDPSTVAVLAPAVIAHLTGVDANPFLRRRPSRWQMRRYRFWLSHYYLMWFKQWIAPYVRILRHQIGEWRSAATAKLKARIYAPHGAFIIFSRMFFDAGGTIDDTAFLYAEEFCVGETCYRLDLPVIHDPELRVWHNAHQTTGRMLTRPIYDYQRQGLTYAWQKYNLQTAASERSKVDALMTPRRDDAR